MNSDLTIGRMNAEIDTIIAEISEIEGAQEAAWTLQGYPRTRAAWDKAPQVAVRITVLRAQLSAAQALGGDWADRNAFRVKLGTVIAGLESLRERTFTALDTLSEALAGIGCSWDDHGGWVEPAQG